MNLNQQIPDAGTASELLASAKWWTPDGKGGADCSLCPRSCRIPEGATGFCGARKNVSGKLRSIAYGRPAAIHIDPIEKKPFAEFLPGTKTFSLGSFGCNLECSFCQNHHLSRGTFTNSDEIPYYAPDMILMSAIKARCESISFTYNEPIIWAEYALDVAKLAKTKKIPIIFVSNAFVSPRAADEIFPFVDAANFDMKGFSEEFYSSMTGGSLAPVLDSILHFHKLGKHLEICNLIIPGKNDSDEMLAAFANWVLDKLGPHVPIHFTAYHPDYKFLKAPNTPRDTLIKAKKIANDAGLRHIYLGNI